MRIRKVRFLAGSGLADLHCAHSYKKQSAKGKNVARTPKAATFRPFAPVMSTLRLTKLHNGEL